MADASTISTANFFSTAARLGFSKKFNFQVLDISNMPDVGNIDENYLLYVQSASLPSVKNNTTTVPYKAFDFVVPTNTTFPEQSRWRVTFFSDNNLLIRNMFENWSKAIYNPFTNSTDKTAINFGNCILTMKVLRDDQSDAQIYKLYGVFPVLVETVDYDISDTGTNVSKLAVALAFQYFTTENNNVPAQ
jgi:hypothetical protein